MMVKNKLEKKFSESFKQWSGIWGMKLHNNLLAHQTTPADYILTKTTTISAPDLPNIKTYRHVTILVEAKQVTLKEGKGRLVFKRLKQMHSLLNFENVSKCHEAYFLIAFKADRWANSDIYMVPAKWLDTFTKTWHNVSINREDAAIELAGHNLEYKDGIIQYPTKWQN